jgi:hypothetical protein
MDMITEKHWSHISNEKEPGNRLSRLREDYSNFAYSQDRENYLEEQIDELLVVIDRQEAELTVARRREEGIGVLKAEMNRLLDQLAAAEEGKRKAFEAGRKTPGDNLRLSNELFGYYVFRDFADYLAGQKKEGP